MGDFFKGADAGSDDGDVFVGETEVGDAEAVAGIMGTLDEGGLGSGV